MNLAPRSSMGRNPLRSSQPQLGGVSKLSALHWRLAPRERGTTCRLNPHPVPLPPRVA